MSRLWLIKIDSLMSLPTDSLQFAFSVFVWKIKYLLMVFPMLYNRWNVRMVSQFFFNVLFLCSSNALYYNSTPPPPNFTWCYYLFWIVPGPTTRGCIGKYWFRASPNRLVYLTKRQEHLGFIEVAYLKRDYSWFVKDRWTQSMYMKYK